MKKMFQLAAIASVLAMALPLRAQDYNIQLRSTLDYTGQTLANICGYAQGGREYALVGASKGLSIVDVTNPDSIYQIVQIPGPNNLWKEIKTFDHYAYVTTEGGGGLQIVDLSKLPATNLDYHSYTGDGTIAGQLSTIHALHIDPVKKFVYVYGPGKGGNQSLYSGGAVVLDLNADPYNPKYAGKFDQLGYVHDGFVYNDTLYAGHINAGLLSIVDMSDKQQPKLLGTVQTPGKFTHNSWLLDDHKHILTTDEQFPSFLTSYDISDPTDIRELCRIAPDAGRSSIGHNTHVRNDWAITSWYIDGVRIMDAHRPENLVQTGRYDTWAGGGEFDGCWGVYPFLPSGNLLATNIPSTTGGAGKLFVLTPTYTRACYLEGTILNGCNGQPLINADIKINAADELNFTKSNNFGIYRTGQPTPGNFTVTISKLGFVPQTINITLKKTEVTTVNLTLQPVKAVNAELLFVNATTGAILPNTDFFISGVGNDYKLKTNTAGKINISCMLSGDYRIGTWGFKISNTLIDANGLTIIALQPDYYDDFELNLGWTVAATATTGFWERGKPQGTKNQNQFCNPGVDVDLDNNELCYITGNAGGSAGSDDVDDGSVTLISPNMQLGLYSDAILNFWYWFYNAGGNGTPPNDNFTVQVTNGQQTVTVLTDSISQSEWRYSGEIHLKDWLPLTDNMNVKFITADDNPGHLVEAGVDIFHVTPGAVSTTAIDPMAKFQLTPNPSAADFLLHYDWPEVKTINLEVYNLLGQPVLTQKLSSETGTARFGSNLPAGVYLVMLKSDGRQSAVIKAIKQ